MGMGSQREYPLETNPGDNHLDLAQAWILLHDLEGLLLHGTSGKGGGGDGSLLHWSRRKRFCRRLP
jgi:hypothetical protein